MKRLRKLRRMRAAEIAHRLREFGCRQWERLPSAGLSSGASSFARLATSAQDLVPGSRTDELSYLHHHYADVFGTWKREASETARKVATGQWCSLNHRYKDLGKSVDWYRDPRQPDYDWPRTFYADIRYGRDGQPDVKYVWELGRQRFLVDLALDWRLNQNSSSADCLRSLLLGWIDDNPTFRGIHWTSALEVAVRSISWIWCVALTAEWSGWTGEDLRRVAHSFLDHSTYLSRHFSHYSSPYNHLIGEATALFLLSMLLADDRRANMWENKAVATLNDAIPKQFYSDGFSVEQATSYHYFTLGFVAMAYAADREGRLSEANRSLIRRAFMAGAAFRQPNGCWAAVGDADSARAIPLPAMNFWDFSSLQQVGTAIFESPRNDGHSSFPGPEVYWLLGRGGVENWNRSVPPIPAVSTFLPASGYAIARHGDDWLMFDAGPIADGLFTDSTQSTAHGHDDALQVVYYSGGRSLVDDCGIPSYGDTPDEWVAHFRGRSAHNTLEVEGQPVCHRAGRLGWSNVAAKTTLEARLGSKLWVMVGTLEFENKCRIERHILGRPGHGLWIADWVNLDCPRPVNWYWQIPEHIDIDHKKGRSCAAFEFGDGLLAAWTAGQGLECRVECPATGSPIALQSRAYGQTAPGRRIVERAIAHRGVAGVHYVGRARQRVAVSINGSPEMLCDARFDLDSSTSSNHDQQSSHRAIWRIEGDDAVCIQVGSLAPLDSSRELTGAGNLRVCVTRLEESLT